MPPKPRKGRKRISDYKEDLVRSCIGRYFNGELTMQEAAKSLACPYSTFHGWIQVLEDKVNKVNTVYQLLMDGKCGKRAKKAAQIINMKAKVLLHIYDVTKGLARTMAPMLIGRPLEGVWHTAVEVFGTEYFYGGEGVCSCLPGTTILGRPDEMVDMGETELPQSLFEEYLVELSKERFSGARYHLLDHNCNTFSNEICQFLTGKKIPDKITNLPADVMNSPLGQTLRPFVDTMMQARGAHHIGPQAQAAPSGPQAQSAPPPPPAAKKGTPKNSPGQKRKDHKDDFGLD